MQFYIYSWITVTILLVCEVKNEPKSGPFSLVTRSLGMCDDGGTNEVYFGKKMSSKGNGVFLYTDDVVFKIPWDDKLKADAEVQQLKNGAYVPKFVTQSFKNCQSMWKLSKDMIQSFFGAAGYNFTRCPLPAGTYSVKDWPVDLKFKIPSFIYGSYKLIVTFSKDKKRVGCFVTYGEAIPRHDSQP